MYFMDNVDMVCCGSLTSIQYWWHVTMIMQEKFQISAE